MAIKQLTYSVVLLSFIRFPVTAEDIFGLRKNIYVPRCAHACRTSIQESPLECSSIAGTSEHCFASNEPYLQTLASCISTNCDDISNSEIDMFWNRYVVGWDLATPQPIYTYQTALGLAGQPSSILPFGKSLNQVSLVAENDYLIEYMSLADWNDSERYHTQFA
jgi:hypothetical protein